MSVTRWDVTPRNASLGLQRLYSGFQLHYDGGAHAPRDERPIAAGYEDQHVDRSPYIYLQYDYDYAEVDRWNAVPSENEDYTRDRSELLGISGVFSL